MRPASRVVPKALLAVVDRPAVQYAVEEAARAGVSEAIIVADLDAAADIDRHFYEEGILPGLESVKVRVIVQEEALGLGHAVWTAREAVKNRPFFCLLADNIVPPQSQILDTLAQSSDGRSVVALRNLTEEFLEKYGVVVPGDWINDVALNVLGAVEKPGKAAAPSSLGLIGRYLFTSDVFHQLNDATPGVGGEIQLTDAIDKLGRANSCIGAVADTDLLDVGNPAGLLEATHLLGRSSEQYGERYRQFLSTVSDG